MITENCREQMNHILLIGLNHKTARVEIREKLAFSGEERAAAAESLKKYSSVHETIVISTCNRVEILVIASNPSDAEYSVKSFICEFKHVRLSQFEKSLYILSGDEAVRHVFRVTASLDSMIIGEPQILGQIKDSYLCATRKKTSGPVLNRLLHRAFFVAKRVRSETGIGDHAVSISYAAIELGRKIFGSLEGKKALLIGAGEMAELAVEHLIQNRAGDIFVANRTFERAVEVARQFNGSPVNFKEIQNYLKIVDIIISSTGSPDFVIRREHVKNILRTRKNRPLFFIDIAVPRDIDPKINRLNNSYVYDIDDLKSVIQDNIEERNKEAVKGERIVDEAVIHFRQWYESLYLVPTITALQKKIHALTQSEVKKTLQSLNHLSENDYNAVCRMTDALVKKLLHDPVMFLKSNGCHGNKSVYLDFTRRLFNLDQ
jgi:glutamyl-tRNA reductase